MSLQNMETEAKRWSPGWPCRPAQLPNISEHQVCWPRRMSAQEFRDVSLVELGRPELTGHAWQALSLEGCWFWRLRSQSYFPCLNRP